jgi:AraC-like DNA-binding protein
MNMTVQLTTPFAEGKAIPVPVRLQRYVRDWTTEVVCREYEFGHILVQYFENTHYKIHYSLFDLNAPAVIVFTEENPAVTLHFMLRGNINGLFEGQDASVLFKEGTYRPMYTPPGATLSTFQKGITELLQFEFDHHYPELFSREFDTLEALSQHLLQASESLLLLPALPITYQVSDTIRNELFALKNNGELLDLQKYIIYRLYWLYHHCCNQQQVNMVKDPGGYREIVQQIRNEIRKEPNKELQTNTYFAQKHHITERTLRRVFKTISGTTLPEFRHEQCMMKAVHLLAEGRLNLEEIAAEIGYGGKSSLSIALKIFGQKSKQE